VFFEKNPTIEFPLDKAYLLLHKKIIKTKAIFAKSASSTTFVALGKPMKKVLKKRQRKGSTRFFPSKGLFLFPGLA
jgi:hypothetical protein